MWTRLISILLLLTSVSSPATAQEQARISELRVDIWPEFDRPAVLVIYRIVLADDITLPVVLNLRVPSQAYVNAVAINDPEMGLLTTTYNRSVVGKWANLAIQVPSRKLQVEYYDALEKNGSTREISYEWPGDAPVDSFQINFHSPSGATDLDLEPAPISVAPDQYDLMNYSFEIIPLEQGETVAFSALYEKADDELGISTMPVEPVIPIEETSGQMVWSDALPWILGGLGLVFIIVGLFFLYGFLGVSGWKHIGDKKITRKRKVQESSIITAAVFHCQLCGRRAQTEDKYCRACGVLLRRNDQ